jgi:hypothetical protein
MPLPPELAMIDWALVGRMGASLTGIGLLYIIAWKMGLGGDPRLADEADAQQKARDGLYGFEAVDIALDKAGMSALLRDAASRHALIFRVGNRFVARLVPGTAGARLDQALLTINLHEPDLPPVILNLGDKAQYWASGLRHIPDA